MSKTLIDLFAGCGGLSLGLNFAGFKSVFANEINPICAETYVKNFNINKEQMYIGDIHDLIIDLSQGNLVFDNIDLVSGGPPCQGFSMANRQRIIDDPRNSLYKAYLEVLSIIRPKFFIMENVKGMQNKISEILADINNLLGSSYNVSYRLLNAKDFGVPQNRERFFIMGNRIGISCDKIFSEISNKVMPKYTLFDAISDLPPLGINNQKNKTSIENDEVGYFKREYHYPRTDYANFINNNREVNFLYNHKNRYNNERDIKIYSLLPQGENSLHDSISDIMPYKSRNHIFKDKYYKLKYDEVCKTITSHMKFDCNMYIHPTQARGLSPREAARIQSFPDDFVFYGPQNSWYLQIGNAVPVKLAEIIGKEIIKCL